MASVKTIKKAEPKESVVAVATDNVPEGEPKENADGSVTAYDENNNPVDTVSEEAVKAAEESVTEVVVDTTSPMEQLGSDAERVRSVEVSNSVNAHRKPMENVKVRLRADHSCCIAGEYYDFKAGKVYIVPRNVKKILGRADLLIPV